MSSPRQLVAKGLRSALQRCGITQRTLAKRLGTSEARVSQVLSGNENITIDTLAKWVAAMGHGVTLTFEADPEPGRVRVVVRKPIE